MSSKQLQSLLDRWSELKTSSMEAPALFDDNKCREALELERTLEAYRPKAWQLPVGIFLLVAALCSPFATMFAVLTNSLPLIGILQPPVWSLLGFLLFVVLMAASLVVVDFGDAAAVTIKLIQDWLAPLQSDPYLCKEALELVSAHREADELRNTVLNRGEQLRMLHLHAFRDIAQKQKQHDDLKYCRALHRTAEA